MREQKRCAETDSDYVGVQFVQNAQILYRKKPKQGCEGLEIDEDKDSRRGSCSWGERAAVRVRGTIDSTAISRTAHHPSPMT